MDGRIRVKTRLDPYSDIHDDGLLEVTSRQDLRWDNPVAVCREWWARAGGPIPKPGEVIECEVRVRRVKARRK